MDWDKTDTALLLTSLGAILADTESTKAFLKDKKYQEANPLLGKKPSGTDLDKVALLSALLTTGTAYALPQDSRRPFLGGLAGLESGIALNNKNKNVKRSYEDPLPYTLATAGALIGKALTGDNTSEDKSGTKISIEQLQGVPTLSLTKKF